MLIRQSGNNLVRAAEALRTIATNLGNNLDQMYNDIDSHIGGDSGKDGWFGPEAEKAQSEFQQKKEVFNQAKTQIETAATLLEEHASTWGSILQ